MVRSFSMGMWMVGQVKATNMPTPANRMPMIVAYASRQYTRPRIGLSYGRCVRSVRSSVSVMCITVSEHCCLHNSAMSYECGRPRASRDGHKTT